MSTNYKNLTPNKYLEHKIISLKSTPKFSIIHQIKENTITKQKKIINSMKNNLFSNSKININFNRNLNNSNSSNFLIPLSKRNINQKANDCTKIINKEIILNNSFSEMKSKNDNNFLNKKRKYLSSEEIELEKIKKEKEINKKLMEKNKKLYLKSFNYSPMKITPSPLTTFIPFKLSCNSNNKYIKEGKGNTLYEINKQNQKIRLKMQQKIEKLSDNKTKDRILLNNVDYLKKQNELYNDLFNKENIINNNSIFNDINQDKKSLTPIKELNNKNDKKNILEYIKTLRNLKNNN